jgi:hypothetical protein
MLYIAIAMILVGILCFVYVSLAPRDPASYEDMGSSFLPGKKRGRVTESDLKEALLHSRHRSRLSPEDWERVLRERSAPPGTGRDSQRSEDPSQVLYTTALDDGVDAPDVVGSVAIQNKEGESVIPEPEASFRIHGLLFTDHKGKIPFATQDLSDLELSPEMCAELRRMGEGTLSEQGGALVFQVKNLTLRYEPRDLKQIVFYDEAAVFLPGRPDLSAPIFFTDDLDELKAFFAQAESKKQS